MNFVGIFNVFLVIFCTIFANAYAQGKPAPSTSPAPASTSDAICSALNGEWRNVITRDLERMQGIAFDQNDCKNFNITKFIPNSRVAFPMFYNVEKMPLQLDSKWHVEEMKVRDPHDQKHYLLTVHYIGKLLYKSPEKLWYELTFTTSQEPAKGPAQHLIAAYHFLKLVYEKGDDRLDVTHFFGIKGMQEQERWVMQKK